MLAQIEPSETLMQIASAMFTDFWEQQSMAMASRAKAFKQDAADVEDKIAQLVETLVNTTNARVMSAIERNIEKLERE